MTIRDLVRAMLELHGRPGVLQVAPGSSRSDRIYLRLSVALFAMLAAVVALTVRDYGVTWDEPFHHEQGKLAFRYYASGLREVPQGDMNLFGSSFELPAELAIHLLPWPEYLVRHVVNACVGLLGIWGAWKVAALIAGPGAGFWAALLLALTPCYYGHMFSNPKDLPFAAGHIWSLYYLLRYARTLPRPPVPVIVGLGLSIGWTCGVRAGGLVLFGYLTLVWLVHSLRTGERRYGPTLLAVAAGYLVMLVFWPYGQRNPLTWPVQTLWTFMHYDVISYYQVMFKGRVINGSNLPWEYIPRYLLINLPELVLVLLAGGVVAAARAALRPGGIKGDQGRAGMLGLVVLAAVFPVLVVIFLRSPVCSGLRHLLFIIPPIACLAGIAMDRMVEWAGRSGAAIRRPAGALLLAYLCWHVSVMVRLHPQQYIYYNALAGGVQGAAGRYDMDYWGNSYPETIRGLVRWLNEREGTRWPMMRYRVFACGASEAFAAGLPDCFVAVKASDRADFHFGVNGYACRGVGEGDVIVVTKRFGVPLSFVRDFRRSGRRILGGTRPR